MACFETGIGILTNGRYLWVVHRIMDSPKTLFISRAHRAVQGHLVRIITLALILSFNHLGRLPAGFPTIRNNTILSKVGPAEYYELSPDSPSSDGENDSQDSEGSGAEQAVTLRRSLRLHPVGLHVPYQAVQSSGAGSSSSVRWSSRQWVSHRFRRHAKPAHLATC